MAAAAGYESVADMLIAEMTAMGLNTSSTAMVGWQGPGGVDDADVAQRVHRGLRRRPRRGCASARPRPARWSPAHTAAVRVDDPGRGVHHQPHHAGCVGCHQRAFRAEHPSDRRARRPIRRILDTKRDAAHRVRVGGVDRAGRTGQPAPVCPDGRQPGRPRCSGSPKAPRRPASQGALQASAKTMTQAADACQRRDGAELLRE